MMQTIEDHTLRIRQAWKHSKAKRNQADDLSLFNVPRHHYSEPMSKVIADHVDYQVTKILKDSAVMREANHKGAE